MNPALVEAAKNTKNAVWTPINSCWIQDSRLKIKNRLFRSDFFYNLIINTDL
jgi:hypothetical protein